jgi:hypothetical protein
MIPTAGTRPQQKDANVSLNTKKNDNDLQFIHMIVTCASLKPLDTLVCNTIELWQGV